MKNIGLTICAVVLFSITYGQSGKLKRADNYFSTLDYALAAEEYESLIGSEVETPKMKSKLAYCYFQMGKTSSAEKVYSEIINTSDATVDDYYHYAQSLKENGKYPESDAWMNKFAAQKQNEVRALDFQSKPDYLKQIETQGVHFEIKHLAVNTSNTDFGGYPAANQETIYFLSSERERVLVNSTWGWNNERFLDVRTGKKSTDLEIIESKRFSKDVNSTYHEGPLCFSADGKKVYFTRNNVSKGSKRDQKGVLNLKMYIADVSPNGVWINEQGFSLNSTEYSTGHPSISSDGKTLYFASDMPGGFGGADIYRIPILDNNQFGKPENLGKEINTEGQDMFPWMNKEGMLFFSSDGKVGLGGLDVFVMLPNTNNAAATILNVGKPVNSSKDDFAFTMLNDNKSGYFSSNRDGGAGGDDIYSYQFTKPFKVDYFVNGIATEKGSSNVLKGAEIQLLDASGKVISSVVTDENGAYSFPLEQEKSYSISAKKTDYFNQSVQFSSPTNDNPTIQKNIVLEKDPGFSLQAQIKDAQTSQPIEGVRVSIRDNQNQLVFLDQFTAENGQVFLGLIGKKINDELVFTIQLQKEGYLSKTVQLKKTITQVGIVNVNESLNLSLERLAVGVDIAKAIDLKPIYFDLGKFIIRPDAATELDKIVKVMNEYPTMVIELGSHTDCRGSQASNEKLSNNRALASAKYISSKITNPERIVGKGYGEAKLKNGCGCEGPVKSTCSDAEHQENRRTEFIILKM